MGVLGISKCWMDAKYQFTSSTSQGGGGSFNTETIGEVSCCDAWMAERTHWWIERWLECRAIYLSICLSMCLSICVPLYLSLWLSVYLSVYLSICLCVDLSICLIICLSVYLSTYLSICLSISLSIYLCTLWSKIILANLKIWCSKMHGCSEISALTS